MPEATHKCAERISLRFSHGLQYPPAEYADPNFPHPRQVEIMGLSPPTDETGIIKPSAGCMDRTKGGRGIFLRSMNVAMQLPAEFFRHGSSLTEASTVIDGQLSSSSQELTSLLAIVEKGHQAVFLTGNELFAKCLSGPNG
ncbi:hypothetical protein GX51_06116 [Blastomyces parvus]|uniref:Uncharacterized protein n=1 Tax=Blastomyces parvus TaxID=2060905 RepID=A0A2B7WT27_9EURO|nr:hypothetical protein GX51_06116 [Blastomyces parvus]